nr:BatD family protein [Deltaproteobacteria bacterium]
AHTAPIRATVADAPARSSAPQASSGAREPAPAEAARAFIKLEMPARTLYVGEAVPVKIRAYFRAGTSAGTRGPPTLSSDAFMLSELSDKPAQTQVEIRGENYLQATWTAVLSPAKPSKGKLGVELPVEIAYREQPRQRRSVVDMFGSDPFGGMDPFSDPFFGGDPFAGFDIDSMFDTGVVKRRELTLRTSARTVTVLEPPLDGRPAGYTGAVGTFDVAIDPPTGEPRVGEPLALTFRASGTGNFERVSITGVAESDALKTYSIKGTFTPSAASKLTGTKTFTQTIVPTRAGELEVPSVALSFFDPEKKTYVTTSTTPLKLDVRSARGAAAPGLDMPAASERAGGRALIDSGETQGALQPRFRQASFWILPGLLVLATGLLVGAAWWRRSPRIASVLASRRVDRAVHRSLLDMNRAAAAGDSPGFFVAARTVLQTRLGERFGIAPDAVTAADVDARLGARGAAIRSVFEHADGVEYAPGIASKQPLDHWRRIVREELARLEVS